MIFGAFAVARHRTVRVAGILAFAAIAAWMLSGVAHEPRVTASTLLVAGGSLAAVAGSRLLAPGAALAAARRTGARWWLVPVGRLTGAVLVVSPAVWIGAIALGGTDDWLAVLRLALVGWLYAAAVAAVSLALAPGIGASPAGALGLLGVWFGGLAPSAMAELLAPVPYLQRPVVLLWNALPLGWRAERWWEESGWLDPTVLAVWVVVGVLLAALGAERPLSGERTTGQPG